MPNSNFSNKNEATQTSNQTIVEKLDDKKHLLMIPYQGQKGEQVIKSVRKTVNRLLQVTQKCKFLLPVTNLVYVSISRSKLSLSIDMM